MSSREDLPEEVSGQPQEPQDALGADVGGTGSVGSADGADGAGAADIDAELAAMIEQLEAAEPVDDEPATVSIEDVPHNTYRDPDALAVPKLIFFLLSFQ